MRKPAIYRLYLPKSETDLSLCCSQGLKTDLWLICNYERQQLPEVLFISAENNIN